jgi:integrase
VILWRAWDLAVLVRDLRAEGLSEASIVVVLGVTGRIYRYAARRLGWSGTNPVALMLPSERPKPSRAQRRRIFEGQELEQTIAAAREPHRTMLTVAALTDGRISELCGLTWADVRAPDGYVFATRTGRPLSQRNVARVLRTAQRAAVDEDGRPTFPALRERDAAGKPAKVPRGSIPSMHSLRHTVASRALLAGESVDEIAFLLGHRDANVTRAVYVRELADTRRRAMRRSRLEAEYAATLEAVAR